MFQDASRRSSFLSTAMLASESISVYDSHSFNNHPSAFKVVCLKESQGFLFNQDLFATPYQQSRSVAYEKRRKSILRQKRTKSQGHVSFSGGNRPKHRSLSSFHPLQRNSRGVSVADSAISEDEPMRDADETAGKFSVRPDRSNRSSISEHFNSTFQRGLFDAGAPTFSSSDDDMDVEQGMQDYSPVGSNHIPVIDIVVEDNAPLFPEHYLSVIPEAT